MKPKYNSGCPNKSISNRITALTRLVATKFTNRLIKLTVTSTRVIKISQQYSTISPKEELNISSEFIALTTFKQLDSTKMHFFLLLLIHIDTSLIAKNSNNSGAVI